MNKNNDTTRRQKNSVHLRLNDDLLKNIDVFTKEYNFSNRTEAMRFLLSVGLKYQKITDRIINVSDKDL